MRSICLMILLSALPAFGSIPNLPELDIDYDRSKNQVLKQFRKSVVALKDGKPDVALRALDLAENDIERLRPKSITGVATELLLTPGKSEYIGEDFEQAFVHYYQGLSFLKRGDLDSALVEANQLHSVLQEFDQIYGDKPHRYGADPAFQIFQGMLFEAGGRTNDAFIAYRNALNQYRDEFGPLTGVQAPGFLAGAVSETGTLSGLSDAVQALGLSETQPVDSQTGTVMVLFETGTAPRKHVKSHKVWIPPQLIPEHYRKTYGAGVYVELRVPEFKPSGTPLQGLSVRALGTTATSVETLTDLEPVARISLEDRIHWMEAQAALRVFTKKLAVHKKQKEFGKSLGKFLGKLMNDKGYKSNDIDRSADAITEVLTQSVINMTEKPDLRSWVELPRILAATRVRLPAGPQELTLSRTDSWGNVTGTETVTVNVPAGGGTIVWRRAWP